MNFHPELMEIYQKYIIEICDDDNLMTYQLTKNPNSKNYEDILFEWETSWNERIKFIEN
jgi:hypothetical protein